MKNKTAQHRDSLLSSIAEAKGYTYTNGELANATTGAVAAVEAHEISKLLLGQMTTEKDIATVESILNVITKLPNYDTLVKGARSTLAEDDVTLPDVTSIESRQTGTVAWFRRMMEACF